MKMILTTIFAIAVVVFAFDTGPVMAGDGSKPWSSNSNDQIDYLDNPDGETKYEGRKYANAVCAINPAGQVVCFNPLNEEESKNEQLASVKENKWMLKEGEKGEILAYDTEHCWLTIKGEVDCDYSDYWWNEKENQNVEIAFGDYGTHNCSRREDGGYHCPGDAWNSEGNEGEQFAGFLDSHCQNNPGHYLCGDLWNEDTESRDGFGGRDVADSGNEGSTSAAQESDQ